MSGYKPEYPGEDGVPWCSYGACPNYDGKRCRLTGFSADGICEPAVIDLAAVAQAAGRAHHEWKMGTEGRIVGIPLARAMEALGAALEAPALPPARPGNGEGEGQ